MNAIITLPANTTPADAATYKGYTVTLNLADGTELTGVLISVNSKGWNVATTDAPCVSRGAGRVTDVTVWDESDDELSDADYLGGAGDDLDPDLECLTMDDDGITPVDEDTEGDHPELAPVEALEGMTTAELATMFGLTAKRLRVTLRAMKLGVGRGQRYNLTGEDVDRIKARLGR